MKEYGMAVEMELDADRAPEDTVFEARKVLDFNYRMTQEAHPDWPLPAEYDFITGPVRPAYEYEDCAVCRGDGQWSVYNDTTYEGEYRCPECDGAGRIAVRLKDPPRWVHQFAWYVMVES